jgi:hypothetical protein
MAQRPTLLPSPTQANPSDGIADPRNTLHSNRIVSSSGIVERCMQRFANWRARRRAIRNEWPQLRGKNGNERRIKPNRLTALLLRQPPSHLLHRHNEFDRTVLVRFRGKHGAARLQITPVQRAIDAVEGENDASFRPFDPNLHETLEERGTIKIE